MTFDSVSARLEVFLDPFIQRLKHCVCGCGCFPGESTLIPSTQSLLMGTVLPDEVSRRLCELFTIYRSRPTPNNRLALSIVGATPGPHLRATFYIGAVLAGWYGQKPFPPCHHPQSAFNVILIAIVSFQYRIDLLCNSHHPSPQMLPLVYASAQEEQWNLLFTPWRVQWLTTPSQYKTY